MSVVELDSLHGLTECRQCGYQYKFSLRSLAPDRATSRWFLCQSCKAVPMDKCWYGNDWCKPWQGDFDMQMLVCLDESGRPVHLGPRSCGHWDCVREEHLLQGFATPRQPVLDV